MPNPATTPEPADQTGAQDNWFSTHCYGCGGELSPELIDIMKRILDGDPTAEAAAEANTEHVACFE